MTTLNITALEWKEISKNVVIPFYKGVTAGNMEIWTDWINDITYNVQFPVINANKSSSISDVKIIFENLRIKDNMLEVPENVFTGFGSMLHSVSNPFQGVSKEAIEFIKEFSIKNGITQAKIVSPTLLIK